MLLTKNLNGLAPEDYAPQTSSSQVDANYWDTPEAYGSTTTPLPSLPPNTTTKKSAIDVLTQLITPVAKVASIFNPSSASPGGTNYSNNLSPSGGNTPSPSKSMSTGTKILIGAGLAVLIGGGIAFAVSRKNKNKKSE
jgi:hypothetical protein